MNKMDELRIVEQAVILAGGRGTRLEPFTETNPKPMYVVSGKPFLEYLILQVKSFGIKDILLLVGWCSEKITDYFGDGSKWGVHIEYSTLPVENETGARLNKAYEEGKIKEEFLLMYCDNYCPINFIKLVREYRQKDSLIQLTVYKNADGYTKNNISLTEDNCLEVYDKTRTAPNLSVVDIGYAIINRSVLDKYLIKENFNFEKLVYPQIVEAKKMNATVVESRYYSVGNWERMELTKEFFNGQKYIFLDRDGTMNTRPPQADYVKKPEEFVWLPGAKEAILKLNKNGYRIILVSNQPGLARGALTETDLNNIHKKMNDDLAQIGAEIFAIYYCPHNWDEGCECRKPKPGMFFKAQKDYSIDLTKCWMIGDDERDMHAGGDAGCKCIYVSEQHPLSEAVDRVILMDKESEEA